VNASRSRACRECAGGGYRRCAPTDEVGGLLPGWTGVPRPAPRSRAHATTADRSTPEAWTSPLGVGLELWVLSILITQVHIG